MQQIWNKACLIQKGILLNFCYTTFKKDIKKLYYKFECGWSSPERIHRRVILFLGLWRSKEKKEGGLGVQVWWIRWMKSVFIILFKYIIKKCLNLLFYFILFFSFWGHTRSTWKLPGQGVNQSCSCRRTPQ